MVIEFGEPIDFAIPIADFPNINHLDGPLARIAKVKVFVLKSAHDQMIKHVNSDKDMECGGVLVGYPFQDRQTQQTFVVIVGVIPDITDNRSIVHFTVTTEAISRTRQIMEVRFPGLIAVGWYHSHPGHGVFLSGQDMTIVRGIYSEPWNLAWVIDPLRNQEGIFYGSKGAPIIENKGSHPLFHAHKIWIPLQDYPECVRALQKDMPVDVDALKHNDVGASDELKAANREVKLKPRREEIMSQRKAPWVLRFFILMYVLSLVATGVSLYDTSWSLYALLLSDVAAILGLYALTSNQKDKTLTQNEYRKIAAMLFSVICFLVISFANHYLDSGKYPDPILSLPSESVVLPTLLVEPSAPATVITPILLSPVPENFATPTEIQSSTHIP